MFAKGSQRRLSKSHQFLNGGVVEWSIAPVLKTGELKGSVGSNPTPSAISCGMRTKFERREAAQTTEGSPEGVEAVGRNQSHPLRH